MNLRTPAALLATAALGLGAAACGSSSSTSSTSSSSSSSSSTKAAAKPVAQVDNLTGKQTSVKLDAGFVKALTSLKVTPGPVGTAKISTAGVASFPITGGNVKYYTPGSVSPYVQGIIHHDGSGLSLSAGGKKVVLKNFNIDPGKSVLTGDVSLNGKQVAPGAPLFFLDGRTLKPLKANSNGTAELAGTTVVLTKTAADLLNKTFGVTALSNKVVIGVATITINTK
jgi:hypothetical protein